MQNIERRIAALEIKANAADGALKFVWMEQGESESDALKRAGNSPDDPRRCLIVSWLDETF